MIPARIPHGRYLGFLAILIVATFLLQRLLPLDQAIAAGFDLAALLFIVSAARHWREGEPQEMRRRAERDEGGRPALLLLTAVILFAVLIVVGGLADQRERLSPGALAVTVTTLVIAWTFANLVFAFHYAKMFYDRAPEGGDCGGLQFPGGGAPVFADFVNFAFVIGMTCQTADITITRTAVRRTSTVHGMLAFFFNLGVLALTVNVLAGAL